MIGSPAPLLSNSHIIVVPCYNAGALLEKTITEILAVWQPVWVVIDGSTDGSEIPLNTLQTEVAEGLRIIRLPSNRGKGAAILEGIQKAWQCGFTHVLVMDADHQHPAEAIPAFMHTSIQHPDAMVLGEPVFDASAPALRVQGRKVSNRFVNLETLSGQIHDSLFGMRIYPIADLVAVMQQTPWARRFDFEPEVVVRLAWRGIPVINLPTPVRYIDKAAGGVSHFRYLRDNLLLTWMHIRLLGGLVYRLPQLLRARFTHL